jgi:antitoxin YefM
MRVTSITELRKTLPLEFSHVIDDNETLIVTKNNQSAVMISLEEYNSLKETSYLLSTQANVQNLSESIAQLDAGKKIEHGLIDD